MKLADVPPLPTPFAAWLMAHDAFQVWASARLADDWLTLAKIQRAYARHHPGTRRFEVLAGGRAAALECPLA